MLVNCTFFFCFCFALKLYGYWTKILLLFFELFINLIVAPYFLKINKELFFFVMLLVKICHLTRGHCISLLRIHG